MVYNMNDIVESFIANEIERFRYENSFLKRLIRRGNKPVYCIVCGKPIKNISIKRMVRLYHWCSRECVKRKPKKVIHLEKEFGVDILEILQETAKRYDKVDLQSKALGMSTVHFYDIIKKYFGSHVEFFAENSSGKRKENYVKKLKHKREIESKSFGHSSD